MKYTMQVIAVLLITLMSAFGASYTKIDSIENMQSQWSPNTRLYVQGKVPLDDSKLNELSQWLNDKAPTWTVLLAETYNGTSFASIDGTMKHNFDAAEHILGQGLRQKRAELRNDKGEAIGASIAIVFKDRKIIYSGADAYESRGIVALDKVAIPSMKKADPIQSVKDVIVSAQNQYIAFEANKVAQVNAVVYQQKVDAENVLKAEARNKTLGQIGGVAVILLVGGIVVFCIIALIGKFVARRNEHESNISVWDNNLATLNEIVVGAQSNIENIALMPSIAESNLSGETLALYKKLWSVLDKVKNYIKSEYIALDLAKTVSKKFLITDEDVAFTERDDFHIMQSDANATNTKISELSGSWVQLGGFTSKVTDAIEIIGKSFNNSVKNTAVIEEYNSINSDKDPIGKISAGKKVINISNKILDEIEEDKKAKKNVKKILKSPHWAKLPVVKRKKLEAEISKVESRYNDDDSFVGGYLAQQILIDQAMEPIYQQEREEQYEADRIARQVARQAQEARDEAAREERASRHSYESPSRSSSSDYGSSSSSSSSSWGSSSDSSSSSWGSDSSSSSSSSDSSSGSSSSDF